MESSYKLALNEIRTDIVNDLIVEDVLPYMRTEIFTADDEQIILTKKSDISKASQFIDVLLTKGNQEFDLFCDIIKDTNEDLYEKITDRLTPNNIPAKRNRRASTSDFVIYGGVPDLIEDYVGRRSIENKITETIKMAYDEKKAVLIHGPFSCGKTMCLIHTLKHSEGLNVFERCCWINMSDKKTWEIIDILKLILSRLDSSKELRMNYDEVYVDEIKKYLLEHSIILVLDNINKETIMKKLDFGVFYVVISENKNLFSFRKNPVPNVEVVEVLTDKQCELLMKNYKVDKSHFEELKMKSDRHVMILSLICKVWNTKGNYDLELSEVNIILDQYFESLYKENIGMKEHLKSFLVFKSDKSVTLGLISICWGESNKKTDDLINLYKRNNIFIQSYSAEIRDNVYSLKSVYYNYLCDVYKYEMKDIKKAFVDKYLNKYQNWLDIESKDPYFFIHVASILTEIDDTDTLYKLLTDFRFLTVKIVFCELSDLLLDYEYIRKMDGIEAFERFFKKIIYLKISHQSSQRITITFRKVLYHILHLAINEDINSPVYKAAKTQLHILRGRLFYKLRNNKPSFKIWEATHHTDIAYFDLNKSVILSASEMDNYVSLHAFDNGRCISHKKLTEKEIKLCSLVNKDDSYDVLVIDKEGIKIFSFGQAEKDPLPIDDNFFDLDLNDNNNNKNKYDSLGQELEENVCSFKWSEEMSDIQNCFYSNNIVYVVQKDVSETYRLKAFNTKGHHMYSIIDSCNPIKKIETLQQGKETYIYVLFDAEQDSLQIFDKYGDQFPASNLPRCGVVTDFVLQPPTEEDTDEHIDNVGLIWGQKDAVYKEDKKILDLNGYVVQLALCSQCRLLAILMNINIWIWDLAEEKITYVLKGEFDNLSFNPMWDDCLITTSNDRIVKWNLTELGCHGNTSNGKNIYRKVFHIGKCKSGIDYAILQNFNNQLKKLTLDDESINDDAHAGVVHNAESKAISFCSIDNYIFIGFADSYVKIFTADTFTLLKDIKCGTNNKLFVSVTKYDVQVQPLEYTLVVHYNETNFKMIKFDDCLNITSTKEWTENLQINFDNGKLIVKFYPYHLKDILIGWCLNGTLFQLKCANAGKLLKQINVTDKLYFNDFDISNDSKFLCIVTSNKVINIHRLKDDAKKKLEIECSSCWRACKFRNLRNSEYLVAVINDDRQVYILRIKNQTNFTVEFVQIAEDQTLSSSPDVKILDSHLIWCPMPDKGDYLIVADLDIRIWMIERFVSAKKFNYPRLLLSTHFGKCHMVFCSETAQRVYTVDQYGYFYVFEQLPLTNSPTSNGRQLM